MNQDDQVITNLLTSYRAIPVMYSALHDGSVVGSVARRELAKILHMTIVDAVIFIAPYRAQIIYAMQDFRLYVVLISGIPTFGEAYWPAMSGEATLVKNLEPFKIPWENPVILDVGAGSVPYVGNFADVNKAPIIYLAADKRYKKCVPKCSVTGVEFTSFAVDIEESIPYYGYEGNPVDVLFLANFLHCLEDIDAFFQHILPCLPDLKIIKILEIKPDCNLDFLFDYHMFQHCKGHRFNFFDLDRLFPGKCKEIASLGDYHEMYTIEL